MGNVRRATVADAIEVAPRLRQADRDECRAYLGLSPEVILPMNVADSEHCWAMVGNHGETVGIFGVQGVDQVDSLGIAWLVSTPDIYRYRHTFMRQVPRWLAKLHDLYPLLGNHIDARNTVHIEWLRRLGFSFLRTHPEFGVERRPFHEFARLRA